LNYLLKTAEMMVPKVSWRAKRPGVINFRSTDFASVATQLAPQIVQAPETKVTTLPSGFQVASETTDFPTASVGVWIDAGSRYEDEDNNGAAHYLEHMAFKGTKNYSQTNLELEIENMGAHLNAYTSREQTVYYAKCFSSDTEKAVQILADILLNSVYNPEAIELERWVILREMEEIEQNMQEVVFDNLHAGAYAGCSLSRTILGYVENIRSMKREHLINYVQKYYKGPRMVLAAAGGIEHGKLVELAQKYFGAIERGSKEVLEYEPGVFRASSQLIEDEKMELVYGALVVEGAHLSHDDNIPMQVVNTLIGLYDRTQGMGVGANSSLATALGGHSSGVESFMSFTTSYKDTGLTGLYFAAEPEALAHLANGLCSEWKRLCDFEDVDRLERAKCSLLSNMQLVLDGTTPICEDIGRQMLCYGRRMSSAEIEETINSIGPDTIRSIGRRYYVNRPFAFTVIGRTAHWPSAESIQKSLTHKLDERRLSEFVSYITDETRNCDDANTESSSVK